MSEIDVSKCRYKGGMECHVRDYPILNCADVKIEDCYYKQLQRLKIDNEKLRFPREDIDFAVLTKEEFENYERLKELEKNTVNETKCGFYHPEHGKECHIALAFADDYTDADHTYLLCEQNPNCYYKQLQQYKSKNEAIHFIADNLQKRNHRLTLKNEELEEKLQQLKAENEKFKNFVAHNLFDVNCDNWLDRFIDYFEKWKHELVAENEELKKGVMLKCPQCGEVYLNRVGCELYEENQKYEQCINEIEKFVDDFCESTCAYSEDEEYRCENCMLDDIAQPILQLIKQTKEGEI